MDAKELPRIELALDARSRRANQMARRSDVQSDIVTIRLPPVHVRCSNNAQYAIDLHRYPVEVLALVTLAVREVVPQERSETLVLVRSGAARDPFLRPVERFAEPDGVV